MNIPYIGKRIISLFITILSGLVAPIILMKLPQFTDISEAGWFSALPIVLMVISVALAICFRQTRVAALALIWLGLASCGMKRFGGVLPDWALGDFVLVVTTLIPWLTLLLFLMTERRVLSARGIARFYIAAIVLGVFDWLPGLSSFHDAVLCMPQWLVGTYFPASLNIAPFTCIIILVVGVVLFFVEQPEAPSLGRMFTALMILGIAAANAAMTCWPDVGRLEVFRSLCLSAGFMLIWTILDGVWRHAYVDELTQLPGRRPMRHHFASLGDDYAIAIADIDHFKKVNDRYGHDVGDQVLRFVSGIIRSVRGGTAYRFGGEEFVIVFGRRQTDRAEELMNQLCETVAGRRFALRDMSRPARKPKKKNVSAKTKKKTRDDKLLKVTISIGVAWSTDDEPYPDDVMGRADKALYKAKNSGRNKVCFGPRDS